MALVAGELTGAGSVDQAGEIAGWFPETRIMYEAPQRIVSKRKVDYSSRCW